KNSVRGRWFREVFMPKWGMDPEGDSFQEGWHSRIRNIFRTPPASPAGGNAKPIEIPAPVREEEDENMPVIIRNSETKEVSLLDPDVGTDLPRLGFGAGKPEYRSEKTAK